MDEIVSVRSIEIVTTEIRMIEANAKRVLCEAVIAIGSRLMEAKELVPSGKWMEYLEQDLGYKPSTAQNYMRIAREFGGGQVALDGKTQTDVFGGLSYTQLLPLVGLPEEERQELAEEHDLAGMSSREIRELVKERDEAKAEAAQHAEKLQEAVQGQAKLAATTRELKDKLRQKEELYKRAHDAERQASKEAEALKKQLAEAEAAPAAAEPDEETLAKIREEVAAEQAEAVREAERRAAEAAAKLEKAKNPAAAQVNFIFGEIGTLCGRLGGAFDSLAEEQPEVGEKFRAAIGQFFAEQAGKYKVKGSAPAREGTREGAEEATV